MTFKTKVVDIQAKELDKASTKFKPINKAVNGINNLNKDILSKENI